MTCTATTTTPTTRRRSRRTRTPTAATTPASATRTGCGARGARHAVDQSDAVRQLPRSSSRPTRPRIPEIPLYYRAETTGVSNHLGGWRELQPQLGRPDLGRRELGLHPLARLREPSIARVGVLVAPTRATFRCLRAASDGIRWRHRPFGGQAHTRAMRAWLHPPTGAPGHPGHLPDRRRQLRADAAARPAGPQAQFNQNPRISAGADRRLAPALVPGAQPRRRGHRSASSAAGWASRTATTAASALRAGPARTSCPQFLGGGTNGIIHGDFGYSIATGRPVLDMIAERIPATADPDGHRVHHLGHARDRPRRHRGREALLAVRPDRSRSLSYIFYSLPTFWLGLILIYIFAVTLHWLPSQGIVDPRDARARSTRPPTGRRSGRTRCRRSWTSARHLVLPVITLVAVSVAGDSRFVRSSMLDTLSQDYVRTARAKGLPRRTVVFRHAFRNALLPILTNVALEIAFLFSRRHRDRDHLLLAGHGPPLLRGRRQPRLLPADGHPAHRLGPGRAS